MLDTPTRDRRAERREATRSEILDAAWAIAREEGLGAIALREVARRVGMQAPSLYSYFASKNDVYDAMYGQAWQQCLDEGRAARRVDPASDPRGALREMAHFFFDFSVADPARYLLMGQRTIPGFEPSPATYQPAIESLEEARGVLAACGVTHPDSLDLYTAMVGGLVAQQVANDPGGNRWKRLVDQAMEAYCDSVGIRNARGKRASTRGKR